MPRVAAPYENIIAVLRYVRGGERMWYLVRCDILPRIPAKMYYSIIIISTKFVPKKAIEFIVVMFVCSQRRWW